MRIPKSMTTEVAPTSRSKGGGRRLRALELVYQQDVEPSETHFPLEGVKVVIGRDPGAKGITLDDSKTSRKHAELTYVAELDTYRLSDLGSRNGVFHDGVKIDAIDIEPGSVLRIGNGLFVYSDVTIPEGLEVPAHQRDVAMRRALAEAAADLAAPTDLPLLVIGPTGAGKEVLAQRIHEKSGRHGNLVAVNCATLGRELIGSELFGHAAGAFSGAKGSRSGLFVSADGGTLFLDEIAELPLEQQPALLRALQERKIRPVGSDREVDVDVRVVAATHQPLDALQASGAFRTDLYARLAGFVIDLPPLSERREEILPLFSLFLGAEKKPLTTAAAEALLVYHWPQNVRELKHAAERAKLFLKNLDYLDVGALPQTVLTPKRSSAKSNGPPPEMTPPTDDLAPTKESLEELLRAHGGNVAQVARATGKHRQQVYRWLKRYDIDARSFRPEDESNG